MMILEKAILKLFPNAIPLVDFNVEFDGEKQVIRDWHMAEPQPSESQLEQAWLGIARDSKLAELNAICQEYILGGFNASNGHTYQFDFKDQDNFTQQMLFLVSDPSVTVVQWKTLDAGIVDHTRDEFFAVCKDADIHKRQNFGKYWTLESRLNNAMTEEEINAINW